MMNDQLPLVSILLPVRNEAAYIDRCLQAILSQDYPSDLIEILIADGLSTDDTRKLIQNYQKIHPQIQLIDNPRQIVPTGLNILISHAKGDILIRVDGHTVVAPDYVRECVMALKTSGADNVGGRMHAVGQNNFGEAVALATSTSFGIGGGRFHYSDKEEWVDTVYMGAWYRRVFNEIGLFDEELVRDQDDEFNFRLRKFDGKILLSPRIKSLYTVRSNPRALWRQYFQYGFWKIRVLQKHPRQMSLRQFIPPIFVMGLFASLSLALIVNWGWLVFVGYTTLYLLANLAASLYTALKKGWKYFWLLLLVFSTIHISYGSGFWVGLVKFWKLWFINTKEAANIH